MYKKIQVKKIPRPMITHSSSSTYEHTWKKKKKKKMPPSGICLTALSMNRWPKFVAQ